MEKKIKIRKICRNCEYFENTSKDKKECWKSPRHKCSKWKLSKNHKRCETCKWFKTKDCPSKQKNFVCEEYESNRPKDIPTGKDVRKMLESGKPATEIVKAHNVEILTLPANEDLNVEEPQVVSLKKQLATVFEVIPLLEAAVKKSPTQFNTYSLTNLIETSRGLLNDIEDRNNPEDLYIEVVSEVIEPLTKQFIELLTVQLHSIRTQVLEMMKNDKSARNHTTILINDSIRNLAPDMKARLDIGLSKLGKILDVNPESALRR